MAGRQAKVGGMVGAMILGVLGVGVALWIIASVLHLGSPNVLLKFEGTALPLVLACLLLSFPFLPALARHVRSKSFRAGR